VQLRDVILPGMALKEELQSQSLRQFVHSFLTKSSELLAGSRAEQTAQEVAGNKNFVGLVRLDALHCSLGSGTLSQEK
tara:strand:+ start:84 stop:317 length:234 start_codon:yes stop_codon:yes gene_type:complete